MKLKFTEHDHAYKDVKTEERFTSVTTAIHKYEEDFDRYGISKKCSTNPKSKWYGMSQEDILKAWDDENLRAVTLGSAFHNEAENLYLRKDKGIAFNDQELPIFKYKEVDGIKYSSKQRLVDGIYPEHLVYLNNRKIAGQVDRLEVFDGTVNIFDYKTNKTIDMSSYVNWEGISKKLKSPLSHLDACNYNIYNLQLSMYMYMILKHNPKLKPGYMAIDHVIFKKIGENKFGYPIYEVDENGVPTVVEIQRYEMDYLENEARLIIDNL